MKDLIKSKYSIFVFNALFIFFLYSLLGEKNIILAFSYFHKMSLPYLIFAMFFCLLNFLISSFRFYFIIEEIFNIQKLLRLVKMNLFSLFLNFYAPLSILGDGFRVTWLKKFFKERSYVSLIKLIFLDRLIALISIFVFMVVFFPYYINKFYLHEKFNGSFALPILSACCIFVFFMLIKVLQSKSQTLNKVKNINKQLILGILYFFTYYLVMVFTIYGLGFRVDISTILISAPIIFILQNLPVGFAGFGLRELGFVLMFEAHLGRANALLISLVLGCVFLASVLPGALFFNEFWIRKPKITALI